MLGPSDCVDIGAVTVVHIKRSDNVLFVAQMLKASSQPGCRRCGNGGLYESCSKEPLLRVSLLPI
jgi:hypothetical protein